MDSLAEGIAHESKVGDVNYSEKVAWQILKDRAILRNNVQNIQGVQWHFFKSSVTGKVGAIAKSFGYWIVAGFHTQSVVEVSQRSKSSDFFGG